MPTDAITDDDEDCMRTIDDECDCFSCRDERERDKPHGPHACIFVGVDDHDECDICGRRSDWFAGLQDDMQPDWDGAA